MKEFIEKLITRIMLESASCKVYKLINPNMEDIAEFNAYKKCIEIVKELAGEYNNDWISCSERLPDESGEYLTYVYYDDYENKYYSIEVDEIDCDGMVKEWNRTIGQIVAWQPLPAPYKEGE